MATVPARDVMMTATSDEMMELAEGQELFSSNLFRLQLAELLSEVRVNYKKAKRTNELLHALKGAMEALPRAELGDETVAELLGKRRLYSGSASQAFAFLPPAAVHVAGSFLLHSHLRGSGISKSVDVLVQIPDSCFHQSDAVSYKYHDKRNAYMLHLAKRLKKTPAVAEQVSVSLACVRGDPMRCFIRLTRHKVARLPSMDDFDIHIYPVTAEGLFKESRLAVEKNNVRLEGEDSELANGLPATPHYNNAVLEEGRALAHLQLLHGHMNACPAMLDALLLLKVWMRQRELDDSADSVMGFHLAMLLAYLASPAVRKVNRAMSSYQIFKVALDFLSKPHLREKGISFASGAAAERQVAAFGRHFEVVFLDASGAVNVAARLSRPALAEVAAAAAATMRLLDSDGAAAAGAFEAVFLQKVPFHLQCDAFLSLSPPFPPAAGAAEAHGEEVEEMLRDRSWSAVFVARLCGVVEKGLGKRARRVALRVPALLPWKAESDCRAEVLYPHLLLGLCFDEEFIYAANTVGPSADAPDADDFRAFWGEKSELVRFADGQILEAVDWETTEGTRHLVAERLLHHVLARHLGLEEGGAAVLLGQLDGMLAAGGAGQQQQDRAFTWNLQVCEKFEKLAGLLRGLQELPLSLHNVLPAHSALSYSHALPVLRHALLAKRKQAKKGKAAAVSRLAPALEVVLQFEGSGQWPDDIVATRKLLSAFLARISNGLESQHSIKTTTTEAYVDVFYGGYAWRLSIYLEKYLALLEQQVSIEAARPLRTALVRRPALVGAMRGLQHSTRVFGETARLAKRWAAAHLFMGPTAVTGTGVAAGSPLAEEAVELVVARLFLAPAPFAEPPRSRLCGFVRFLHALATHPWDSAPYVVDLNGQLTAEHMALVDHEFQASRGQGAKAKAMFLASPLDARSEHWTAARPTAQELARVVAAARRSLNLADRRLAAGARVVGWRQLFRPALEEFDAVLVLEPALVPGGARYEGLRALEKAAARMRDLQTSAAAPVRPQGNAEAVAAVAAPLYKNMLRRGPQQLLVGFNPLAHFIAALEAHLGDVALFFHGGCGESVVGVVWRPAAFLPQPAKPRALQLGQAFSPVEGSPLVVRSVFDIVHDIRSLGAGLVKDVILVPSDAKLRALHQ